MNYFVQVFVIPAVLTIGYFYGGLIFQEVGPAPLNPSIPHTQVSGSGPLLINGTLMESGYMTTPLKVYNEESLAPWQRFRQKKWDHIDVITDKVVVTIAVVDIFFFGEVRVNYFDFTTREFKTLKKPILPSAVPKLSKTSYRFTTESKEDDIIIQTNDFTLRVENIDVKGSEGYNTKHVLVDSKELDLHLEFSMNAFSDQEAIVSIIPLTKEKQHFLYTVRMPNILTEGSLRAGLKEFKIRKDNAGAYLDFTRAVWTYNTYWVYARGQGFLENKEMFSLQLASGYGDNETMQATEDTFFIGKKSYKLNIVQPSFDENNLMNPLTFKSISNSQKGLGECEIIFATHYQDKQAFNVYVLKSDMKQLYGQFSGWVSDEQGNKYTFENLNGFVEIHKAKW